MKHSLKLLPWLVGSLLLTTAALWAQPSQFSGLLKTDTDYTCSGTVPCSTWPMPALPAAGGSYADTTFGTATYRLAAPSNSACGSAISIYSRVQAWNSDGTRMLASENCSTFTDLYDATTTPPTPVARILLTTGCQVDAGDNDVNWANTDPHRIYFTVGSTSCLAHSLQLEYIDVTEDATGAGGTNGCTSSGCTLLPHIVHTFACTTAAGSNPDLGDGIAGNKIEIGSGAQGNFLSSDDRFFAFSCDKVDGLGRHEIDVLYYDRQLDSVLTQVKWYTLCGASPANCKVFVNNGSNATQNLFRMAMHPNGADITMIWQCGVYDEQWTRGCGTEDYSSTYTFKGVLSGYISHQDFAYDVNGKPVVLFVGANTLNHATNSRGSVDDGLVIEVNDLTNLSTSLNASGIPVGKIHVELPCKFGYSGGSGTAAAPPATNTGCYAGTKLGVKTSATHISGTGGLGSAKGYALVSTLTNYGANSPVFAQDAPATTTLTAAITGTGSQTFPVASTATIAVGVGITIGVTGGANPDFCTVTAVSGLNVTCNVGHTHVNGETVQNTTVGDTGFGAFENFIIKIDTTQADWAAVPYFARVGRTMSIRDADYNAEPHTAVNRDFTQIIWGSNWNVDGGTDYGFWTKLSGGGGGGGSLAGHVRGVGHVPGGGRVGMLHFAEREP